MKFFGNIAGRYITCAVFFYKCINFVGRVGNIAPRPIFSYKGQYLQRVGIVSGNVIEEVKLLASLMDFDLYVIE